MIVTTFTNSKKPELIKAVMLANLAACAHMDKDIREQYVDKKISAPPSGKRQMQTVK